MRGAGCAGARLLQSRGRLAYAGELVRLARVRAPRLRARLRRCCGSVAAGPARTGPAAGRCRAPLAAWRGRARSRAVSSLSVLDAARAVPRELALVCGARELDFAELAERVRGRV